MVPKDKLPYLVPPVRSAVDARGRGPAVGRHIVAGRLFELADGHDGRQLRCNGQESAIMSVGS